MASRKIVNVDTDVELYEFYMSPHYRVVCDEFARIQTRAVDRIMTTKPSDTKLSIYKANYDGMSLLIQEFEQHRTNLVTQRNQE